MQSKSEPRTQAAHGLCPIGRAASLLGDYWVLVILRHALLGFRRFEDWKGQLGIADNILSNRLNRLVAAGLLVRVPYRDARRTRHEYHLTAAGAATEPVLRALAAWGQEQTPPPPGAGRLAILHTRCGATVPPGPVCAACGDVLQREQEAWAVPWMQEAPIALAGPTPSAT